VFKHAFYCYIFFSSIAFSQWIDLDISGSQGERFEIETLPLFRGLSSSISASDIHFPSNRHRSYFGYTLNAINATYYSGLVPSAKASISPSRNLALDGRLSAFTSGSELMVVSGYGLRLTLLQDSQHPWFLLFNSTGMNGSLIKRVKSTQFGLHRWNTIFGIPFIAGLEYHFIRGSMLFADNTNTKVEDKSTQIILGFSKKFGSTTILPKLSWHPSVVTISVEMGLYIY